MAGDIEVGVGMGGEDTEDVNLPRWRAYIEKERSKTTSRKKIILWLVIVSTLVTVLFHSSLRTSYCWRMSYPLFYDGELQDGGISHVDASVLYPSPQEDSFRLHPERHVHRSPKTLNFSWNVTLETIRPDGVSRPVFHINGMFPGPTIEARPGDELVVDVFNGVDSKEPLSIHWHGLFMRGYNHMDGVAGLTQRAIAYGRNFTYRFKIDNEQSGTYWYHGHVAGQRIDGLYGGLVVHEPSAATSSEMVQPEYLLLIGDWYHRRAKEMAEWYMDSGNYANEPGPDSILINGRGHFDCSMATKARPVDCIPVSKPEIKLRGDRPKVRIVNTGAMTGFTMAISKAAIRLTHLDGNHEVLDAPKSESLGVLYPGERMDVVFESATRLDSERILTIALDDELLRLMNFALTERQFFPVSWTPSSVSTRATAKHLDLTSVTGLVVNLAENIPHKEVFYVNMEIRNLLGNRPVGVVNRTSWHVEDPLGTPIISLDRSKWETSLGHSPLPGQLHLQIPRFEYEMEGGRWVELVINNVDDRGHPFHLHGHSFYVVARHGSQGTLDPSFNPFKTETPPLTSRNTYNPIEKDTIYIPQMGYVVIRFQLGNEGLWLLHCHAVWHHLMGMGIPIEVTSRSTG